MTDRPRPQISSRKQPKQARSAELVAAILQAAIQVLAKEGAQRFTTARVAEKAGVSVGSVYQYFPNKASILFRLQTDEWKQTTDMMRGALEAPGKPPLERLRNLVHVFVQSECEEVEMRGALDDAAPLYRNAPEAQEARAAVQGTIDKFMLEVWPGASADARTMAGDMILTTLSTMGKHVSNTARTPAEARTYGDAIADMFCAYLEQGL